MCNLTKIIASTLENLLVYNSTQKGALIPRQIQTSYAANTFPEQSMLSDHGATETCIRRTDAVRLPLHEITTNPPYTNLQFPNGTSVTSYGSAVLPIGPLSIPTSLYEDKDLGRSLFSPGQATELGCETHETKTGGTVLLNGEVILTSDKAPGSRLWTIPLDRFHPLTTCPPLIKLPDNERIPIPSTAAYMGITAPSQSIAARVKWCQGTICPLKHRFLP